MQKRFQEKTDLENALKALRLATALLIEEVDARKDEQSELNRVLNAVLAACTDARNKVALEIASRTPKSSEPLRAHYYRGIGFGAGLIIGLTLVLLVGEIFRRLLQFLTS